MACRTNVERAPGPHHGGDPDRLHDLLGACSFAASELGVSGFSPPDVAALTFAVVAINSWNRLTVGLGADVSLDGIEAPLTAAASRASVGEKGDQ
jgi:hypothetical protein